MVKTNIIQKKKRCGKMKTGKRGKKKNATVNALIASKMAKNASVNAKNAIAPQNPKSTAAIKKASFLSFL
jgi:hypothetical protein